MFRVMWQLVGKATTIIYLQRNSISNSNIPDIHSTQGSVEGIRN
jgi:hypothetical protein